MGIQDRQYDRSSGGQGGGFNLGNFFDWSFPLFRVPQWIPGIRGIFVRIHILYIVIAASELFGANRAGSIGLNYVATMLGVLFIIVLLHEFGHCLACRLVGGRADQILIWPLGGLAMCSPPHRWKAALITTIGGPGVNVILFPVFALALVAAGASWSEVIFNPFSPGPVMRTVYELGGNWLAWLWAAHYMNLVLLAFNIVLPMYPMDGGRIVQELLWWRIGYKRSMTISVNIGLLCAVVLGVFAIVTGQMRLVGIAIFGGITCFQQKQHLAMMQDDSPWAYDTEKGNRGFGDDEKSEPSWFQRRAAAAAQKRQADLNAEVDRILAKIRTQGMGSLTDKERATLQEASKR